MIVPKKTVCDVCGVELQKRKNYYQFTRIYADIFNKEYFSKRHMCLNCFAKFQNWFENNKL